MAAAPPLTAGEAWARRELKALRAGAFAPDALWAFLSASRARAAETRRLRADLAHQSRAWIGIGAVAWVGLAAAGLQPFRPGS